MKKDEVENQVRFDFARDWKKKREPDVRRGTSGGIYIALGIR